jgi:hypothetical protein
MFLTLAGGQPSVVRAVLMGATVLLIRESDQRSRGAGVLLLTLILMLLIRPDWAHSVGFQLSAAATAGPHLVGPRCGTTTFALLSIADPLAGFCNRGVLGGLDLDPAASIASFRIHTALRAGGQSAGGTPVGSPHVVGDGPSGGRLALAPPSFGGIVLARAATRGDVDFAGALD